jgi:DNA-binding protein H-NS
MTKRDIERMPLDDLWSLHEQICSVLETKIKDEKRKLEHRLDELGRKSVPAPGDIRQHQPSPKGGPKYRNPEDPTITWSGRGRHPRWLNELLAAGRAIDDFRIA